MENEASAGDLIQGAASGIDASVIVLAVLTLVVGLVVGRLAGRALAAILIEPLGTHRTLILRRIVTYGIFSVFTVAALHQLGFELSVLLGAAGILSVAIGFAAQTAASNLVSGLFLLGERPFEIGETVAVAGTTGQILSIDLLSIKIRTFDNLYVRIPNETVMKSAVTNYTRFPIRRHDLKVFVDANADLDEVERVLLEATRHALCLDEPKPIVILLGYAESGLEIQLSAWALRDSFLPMRNQLHRDVATELKAAGIPFGYPNRIVSRREPTATGEIANEPSVPI